MPRSGITAVLVVLAGGWGRVEARPLVQEPAAEVAAIRGRVVDVEGRPLADVQVLAAPPFEWSRADQGSYEESLLPAERTTRTDAEGRFELGLREPAIARVLIRREGFMELDLEAEWVAPGIGLDLGEVALAPGALLRGRVVDEDGRPIAGARLARTWAEGRMSWWAVDLELARTDADGRFALSTLRPGWTLMTATADGFVPLEWHFDVPRPGGRLEEGPLGRPTPDPEPGEARVEEGELVLTLARGPTVRGRVDELAELRAPWVLAEVGRFDPGCVERHGGFGGVDLDPGRFRRWPNPGWTEWAFVPVRADGSFEFGAFVSPGRPAPEVALTPVARWEPWVEPLGPTVVLAPDDLERELVLALAPLARVGLRVVDGRDGRALEELEVRVAPRGWHPRPLARWSFPGGRVELELRATELDLWVAAPGHVPLAREGIALAPDGTNELGELALEPAPMLELTVVDARTGAPIEGARVERGRWSWERRRGGDFEPDAFRSARTDADGRARVVQGGPLWVHADGYAGHVEDRPQRAAERTIELEPAPQRAAIEVLVTHASGATAANWPLVVDDDVERAVLTDAQGRARLEGPLGEVSAWTRGYWAGGGEPSPWEPARAELGGAAPPEPLHLRLPELVPVELTVLEDGRPLPGALVGPASWGASAPTDGRGRVLGLRGAVPGPIQVEVWHVERPDGTVVTLEIERGRRDYAIDLAPPR